MKATERKLPAVSKAQNRLMHAVAEGKSNKVPKGVAEEFIDATHGESVADLPDHLSPKKKKWQPNQ